MENRLRMDDDADIRRLKKGNRTWIRPLGNSMYPQIKSGQEVLLSSLNPENSKDVSICPGDVCLCDFGDYFLLHKILYSDTRKDRFLIGDNLGNIDGWVDRKNIHGKVILIV